MGPSGSQRLTLRRPHPCRYRDDPQASEELRIAAERLGPVAWVVNSHWHGDHIRGNQAFADAEIVATARTKELIETRAAEQLAEQKAFDWETYLAAVPTAPTQPTPGSTSPSKRGEGVRQMAATIAEVELRPPTRTFEGSPRARPGCELITRGGDRTE